ncbi:cation:proton antiporter domain-containing protein [Syntrophomonas curvata]
MGSLSDIVIIFGLAVGVIFICYRLKIPSIVGFLLTGILAGPHGMALIKSSEQVQVTAEIGVIFLLFSIGLEFSFKNLREIKKTVLLGGSLQVLLTVAITAVIAWLLGMPVNQAIFLGFLVSLSSTAIVLKQLGEKAEMDTPQGKINLGILIFQDIIVVAMMLFTPLLGTGAAEMQSPALILAKTAGVIILVIVLAIYAIPPLLYQITRTQSRELFLLSIILICFAVAWLTASAGLSLALGAFLAGLIIAESEYSHQAMANILPFIDTFTSIFFVSIGMLLNVHSMGENLVLVAGFTLALLVVKSLVALFTTIVLGYPLRTAVIVGFSLCQVGEFSFILAQTGIDHGLLGGNLYQVFLAASILTMMMTPFLMNFAPRLAGAIYRWHLPERLRSGIMPWAGDMEEQVQMKDHLIIVGYGINGRNLSRAASFAGVPYVILEINGETVKAEKEKGEPIFYGDATHEVVLNKVNIESARVLVIAISDSVATRRITDSVRRINPAIHIIVRTRFVADVHDLYELGASEVIPEEYETSVEIFARVLNRYLIPDNEIECYIDQVRKEDYEMFRNRSRNAAGQLPLPLSGVDIGTVWVEPWYGVNGKSLAEIDLRKHAGITVLAIYRGQEIIPNPGADDVIKSGDKLIIIGEPARLRQVFKNLAHRSSDRN